MTYIFSIPGSCRDEDDPLNCAISSKGNVDEVYRGGIYNTKDAENFQGPLKWNRVGIDLPESVVRTPHDHYYFKDNLTIGGNFSPIADFPFVSTASTDHSGVNAMGLGRNSTVLNRLYELGRIPSRVWGFWGGWTGATFATIQQGSLVLGGYDASKVSGAFGDKKFEIIEDDAGCNLRVVVTDIRVRTMNGVERSIFEVDQSMDACIVPSFNAISLPRPIVDNIASINDFEVLDTDRSMGLYSWGFEVPIEKKYGFLSLFGAESDLAQAQLRN